MSQVSDLIATAGSLDLGRLVQQQLSHAQRELAAGALETLEDLDTMVNELSKIAKICADYMDHVKEKPVTRAFEEMEYGFEWARFIQEVRLDSNSPSPTVLFRAARRTRPLGHYMPPSERNWSFDQFRRCHPVSDLLSALERMIGNGATSNTTVDRRLTSMSPILQWAVHTTGQEHKNKAKNEEVELEVFELKRLQKASGFEIFRISDVAQYLEKRHKAHSTDALLQWTRNCDAYVTVGPLPADQRIKSIPWKDLWRMPLLTDTFYRAYTLDIYRQWGAEASNRHGNVENDEVCSWVLESAKTIAGRQREDVKRVAETVELLLEPGLYFWGIDTDTTHRDVRMGCAALLEEDLVLQKLTGLST
ncbi:hypothetical protein PMIN04_010328 [Paraphaeosphaeria minitans]